MKKYTLNEFINETFNTAASSIVCGGDYLSGNAQKAGGSIVNQVVSCGETKTSYPYYNVVQVDDTNWVIEIALAGYSKKNISVEEKDGYLLISGKQVDDEKKYIHRGIALRSFKKSFKLTEWMIVRKAEMNDGILSVSIELVVPEEKKPKKFEIG